jgi:succinoglycan biosynthesis protein ExoA
VTSSEVGGPQALPPLPDPPRVSVIIPARSSAATLGPVVEAVLAQHPAVDEVVIAVGPSADGTEDLAAQLAARERRVVVIDNPSGRTPDALNAAIAASSGDVVVRVDAHAVIPPGYVDRAVEALRRTGAANVGGRQVPTAETGMPAAIAEAMRSPAGAGGAAYRSGSEAGPVDTVYLGVFHREALRMVGGYDPRFVRNQDAELNLRLHRAGYTVWFDPELEVAYRPRATLRDLAAQYFQYGRWRRLTARVHRGSVRARQLAPPVVVAVLGASVIGSLVLHPALAPVSFGAYGLGLVVAAATTRERAPIPPLAAALAVMHLSWGTGFLVGPPRGAAAAPSLVAVGGDDGD